MEILNGLTMGRRRFSALAIPRTGLRLRAINNGDGTVTLQWSGYDLEAVDPAGGWFVEESLDGSSWSAAFDTSPGQLGDDWGAGVLGVVNYFRVKAYDSNPTLLKTSNVVTVTLPEPWELSNVVAYLDADDSRLETIPGLRMTRAVGSPPIASPHYSAPHLSVFDGASAMTLVFWKKEYGPGSIAQSGYIQQGFTSSTGSFISDGWCFASGAYGGDYCGDAAQFRINTAGVTKDWIFSSGAGETAVGPASCYAVTFNAGTVEIWIDGTKRTLTAPGSPPAVLPTSSELLRIARGYSGSNFTWCHASGYSRKLSDAEIQALTLNLDKPVLYSALTTEQKADLVFHYEHGQADCDHTAASLTAVSGGGVMEYTVVAQQEPVSGEWLRTKFGRGPKLDTTGIFAAGLPCLDNDATIHNTTYSRCHLSKAVASNILTSTTNSWFYQYKPVTVAASENFGSAIDGGVSVNEYIMPGYFFTGGSNKAAIRMRSASSSPTINGWWVSDIVMAADTAYTTFWHANAGTFTHFQNGTEGTVTGSWGGGGEPTNSFAHVVGQDNLGAFQNGGSWKGREGTLLLADPKLTSAQQAQLTAYFT